MNNNEILKSGIAELDNFLGGGFHRGQVYIVAARPMIGKTTVLFDIAKFIANNERVKIYYQHTDQYDKKVLNDENIFYSAGSVVFFADFIQNIKEIILKKDVGVVIVDTVNINNNKSSYLQIKELYKLAKELNIVIIVSSNLNRNMFRRKNMLPKIEDIKVSGDYCRYIEKFILINNIYRYFNENMSDEERENNWNKLTFVVYDNQKREIGKFERTMSFTKTNKIE